MFKRPHSAKTSAPVRSSDLRKLRDSLAASFPSLAAGDHKLVLKLLLPDGTLTAKATTHLDDPLTLYFAPASGGGADPDPRFFRIGKNNDGLLVPTCYALDLVPMLLPALETAAAVVENLVSGSALFLSGVSPRTLRALPDSAREGDLVAVTVYDEDRDGQKIVAVGTLAADKATLIKLQQQGGTGKGAAVHTLHARGDFLWQSGSGVEASPMDVSTSSPPTAEAPSATNPTDTLSSTLASTSLSRDPSADSPPTPAPIPSADLTPAQVDTILLNALLLSIRTVLSSSSASSSFPLPASSLYSQYILPYRPASLSAEQRKAAEIKKSGWKSLGKFVKEVSGGGGKKGKDKAGKEPLLQAKEVRGEWVVTGVNGKHPDVDALRSYRTIAQETSQAAAAASAGPSSSADAASPSAAEANGSDGAGGIEVKEYWKPSSDSVKELLSKVEHERPSNGLYTTTQLSSLLRSFATHYSLPHPRSQKHLLLSPSSHPSPSTLPLESLSAIELLARVVCKKGESAEEYGKDEGRRGLVEREKAAEMVREGCTAYWGYRRGGEEVIKKGSPPTIKVQIKNVGKRQVTLVSGHEAWDLFTSDEFAQELKHASASSTSVQPLAGSAKKGQTPKVEIMCQGTHDALVLRLLSGRNSKYGLPRRYVEVDTTKSKR
ncbi:hypothetical protein JCM8097_006866 [Rhodosporidiobolus ruineniae]